MKKKLYREGRKMSGEERARKKLEKNLVIECNKIQKKYYLELFKRFA